MSLFLILYPDFSALASDSLRDIVNNNPLDYLWEFISILAKVKEMWFARQSETNKGRWG